VGNRDGRCGVFFNSFIYRGYDFSKTGYTGYRPVKHQVTHAFSVPGWVGTRRVQGGYKAGTPPRGTAASVPDRSPRASRGGTVGDVVKAALALNSPSCGVILALALIRSNRSGVWRSFSCTRPPPAMGRTGGGQAKPLGYVKIWPSEACRASARRIGAKGVLRAVKIALSAWSGALQSAGSNAEGQSRNPLNVTAAVGARFLQDFLDSFGFFDGFLSEWPIYKYEELFPAKSHN